MCSDGDPETAEWCNYGGSFVPWEDDEPLNPCEDTEYGFCMFPDLVPCWTDEDCEDGIAITVDSCDPLTQDCLHCWPECDGKECGPDACGGSCGNCPTDPCFAECSDGLCQPSKIGPEICDGLDNDCDGLTDEHSPDCDCDGVADCIDVEADSGCSFTSWMDGCCPNGCIGDGIPDELDNCPADINPEQMDSDGDGFGDVCDGGCWLEDYQQWDDDCDGWPDMLDCIPFDPEIHPGAEEICDEIDNDCNGLVDDDCICVPDCQGKDCGDDGCGGSCGGCDDGNLCTTDSCDEVTGQCGHEPKDCDDNGNSCSEDICHPLTGQCIHYPEDCDDGDCCTIDSCDEVSGQCKHIPCDCNDYNLCTVDTPAACVVPGAVGCIHDPIDCDDGDPLTCDICEPSTGWCVNTVDCDDGNQCTDDICILGAACFHEPKDCDDEDPCTKDSCNPVTGECKYAATCYDNNLCTVDYCDEDQEVMCSFVPVDCDDGNLCTVDSCDPVNGCVHWEDDCGSGPCETCVCVPETGECIYYPKECDDDDPCTDDVCDEMTGQCIYPVKDCSDGDPCTDDFCDPENGGCFNVPVNCDDDNPCTLDWCDPETGECVHEDCSIPPQCSHHADCDLDEYCDYGDDACEPVPGQAYLPPEGELPVEIPEEPVPGLKSVIEVTAPGIIAEANVKVMIAHPYIGDLTVSLSNGTKSVDLHLQSGGASDNLYRVYDLSESPDGPEDMSVFHGAPVAGEWTLSVQDWVPGDEGVLEDWRLFFIVEP